MAAFCVIFLALVIVNIVCRLISVNLFECVEAVAAAMIKVGTSRKIYEDLGDLNGVECH